MSDETKPSYEELEVLALLGLYIARDVDTGFVDSAKARAKLVRLYGILVRRRLGEGKITAWESTVPLGERLLPACALARAMHAAHACNEAEEVEAALVDLVGEKVF